MELPVDSTESDASPEAILRAVDSQTLLERALSAADIDANPSWNIEHLIDDLSPIERQTIADELRYTGQRTIRYYKMPNLGGIDLDALPNRIDTTSYGVQLRAADELFERQYLVFSVPAGGAQAQLSVSDDNRYTTIATFDPGYEVVAVRAPSRDTADATCDELTSWGTGDSNQQLNLLDSGRLSALESELVHGYRCLTLRVTRESAQTDFVELSNEDPEDITDIRKDQITKNLLSRADLQRESARAALILEGTELSEPLCHPLVDVSFTENTIHYRSFYPESVLVAVDRTVQSL